MLTEMVQDFDIQCNQEKKKKKKKKRKPKIEDYLKYFNNTQLFNVYYQKDILESKGINEAPI